MLLPFVRELFAEVERLPSFTRVASHLRESAGRIRVTGLSPAAKALIVILLRRTVERPFIFVVADNRAAEELLPILRAFCELTGAADPDSVVTLPARDVLPFQNLSPRLLISLRVAGRCYNRYRRSDGGTEQTLPEYSSLLLIEQAAKMCLLLASRFAAGCWSMQSYDRPKWALTQLNLGVALAKSWR